jgi:diguanylate cyclase
MALEYKSKIGLDVIMPVLDEYVVWYGKIVRAYFEGELAREPPPAVFTEWLSGAGLPENVVAKARGIHQEMTEAANKFITKFSSHENPPLAEYNDFSRYYEEFIQFMRRLEFEQASESSIFDEKTGLRSVKFMRDDIAREMERRARRGNPFSLALVKINNFKDEWRGNEAICRPMVVKIADKLKECLRSFDDAYYLGDEYFLLSLKHADLLGSQAALTRLNGLIAASYIPAPDAGSEEISVSTVLSEPTPGDKFDDLLTNMKKDLQGIEAKGTVLQYNELSPIQRYIHSIEKGK